MVEGYGRGVARETGKLEVEKRSFEGSALMAPWRSNATQLSVDAITGMLVQHQYSTFLDTFSTRKHFSVCMTTMGEFHVFNA